MNKEEVKVALLTHSLFLYVHPNHLVLPEKTTCFDKSFFQLYLPAASYIAAQLYSAYAE